MNIWRFNIYLDPGIELLSFLVPFYSDPVYR